MRSRSFLKSCLSQPKEHCSEFANNICQAIGCLSFGWKNCSESETLLFSAHISYGKGKYLNQTGFFLQNLPRIIFYVIWRSTFTEFNWHEFSSMRYVFVKIFGLFWEWRKWPHNDPKMTPKMTKIQNFLNFHRFRAFFAIFFDKHRRLECWKRSTRHEFVVQWYSEEINAIF